MTTAQRTSSTSGFILAEVLAAISVFSIAALAITALFITATRNSTVNERSVVAMQLAQDELEELQGAPYALVDDRTASFLVDGVSYQLATTVTPDSPVRNVKYITVTLSWSAQDGTTSTVAIDTIHANTDA